MVYQPVLSVTDNIGWYITQFLSIVDKIGRKYYWFCLSWTIIVVLSPDFVCHGQYWLVYHRVLSVIDIII